VRPLATASKAVLSDAALIIAVIDELDLQDALCLALLLKERIHHGAPVPAHIVQPISMDELFERDRFALALRPFENCARLARRRFGPPASSRVR
jgi:butyrate kinase